MKLCEYAVRSIVNIIAIDSLIFRQYIGKMKTPTHKMIFEKWAKMFQVQNN